MRKIFVLILSVCSVAMYAVVAKPGSGVYGDEHYHYRLDENNQRTDEVRTPFPAFEQGSPRRAPQISTTFPTTGQVRSLVILVNFQDVKFVTPDANEAFSRMLNEPDYRDNKATGSARDYFLACSMNQFDPTFDVYGPVTISQKMADYGDDRVQEMIVEACDSLEHVIDWDAYDVNDDGDVDNIFVYFAGYNEAEGGPVSSIWPHRAYIYTQTADKQFIRYYYVGKSGKRRWLWDYACTSELKGKSGSFMCGIGTFCHEFSHVLGLDDLYDTQKGNYTVGEWDLMCAGNYNNDGRTPPALSAFERFILGWIKPEQLTNIQDNVLLPLETTNHAYLIAQTTHNMNALNPDPAEYWLLENRQRVGWDAPSDCLPGTGLMISHITWNEHRWEVNTANNSTPLLYDICEAYNQHPTYSTASDLFPGTGNIRQFVPKTNDKQELKKQQLSNIHIANEVNIAFHYGPDDGSGFILTNRGKECIVTEMLKIPTHYELAVIDIEGTKLGDSLLTVESVNSRFAVSRDGVKWSQSYTDSVRPDGTYSGTCYVRYNPRTMCDSAYADIHVALNNDMRQSQLTLMGRSVREQLIHEVEALEASAVSPYSAVAHWKHQNDAESYVLKLFTLNDEVSTTKVNVNKMLTKTGETYRTDYSILPVTQLELNYNQYYTSSEGTGYLLVEGQTEDGWNRIDSILIRPNSDTFSKRYKRTEADDYHAFRVTFNILKGEAKAKINYLTMRTEQTAEYVYHSDFISFDAYADSVVLSELQPETDYYYYVICEESKGCATNVTDPGNVMHVRTLPGATQTNKQFTTLFRNGEYRAYFPEPVSQGSCLLLFASDGRFVREIPLAVGDVEMSVPTHGLIRGQLYYLKYVTGSSLKRKQLWSKFVY